MNNQKRYWLRGGIISLSIFVVLVFSAIFFEIPFVAHIVFFALIPILALGGYLISGGTNEELLFMECSSPECFPMPNIFGFLILAIVLFLPGTIMGAIYGKVKYQQRFPFWLKSGFVGSLISVVVCFVAAAIFMNVGDSLEPSELSRLYYSMKSTSIALIFYLTSFSAIFALGGFLIGSSIGAVLGFFKEYSLIKK